MELVTTKTAGDVEIRLMKDEAAGRYETLLFVNGSFVDVQAGMGTMQEAWDGAYRSLNKDAVKRAIRDYKLGR